MGWRGTIRTLSAMARAAERDARRRARDQARHFAEMEKIEEKERAAEAVQEFEEFLKSLVSAHQTCSSTIDWQARMRISAPSKPNRTSENEDAARIKMVTYAPSFFDWLLRRIERQRAVLEKMISVGRVTDESTYHQKYKSYETALAEYEDKKDLATRVLANESEAMLEFIKALDPFGSIAQLGESLRISIPLPSLVIVELNVYGEEVVPKETAKLLVSGKVSRKVMPKGDYYRLYQDHVCSVSLRVAREILAAVPVDSVIVTAVDELLDLSTGNLAIRPILSFLAPRTTLAKLNFASLDPSDAMRNFVHNMDFRTTAGFQPVNALDSGSVG